MRGGRKVALYPNLGSVIWPTSVDKLEYSSRLCLCVLWSINIP
jgi:hypothetical protein